MRAYGRVTDKYGNKTWVTVQTDSGGDSSYVYVTALAQCLQLNLNESPFWSNFGIPAKAAVIQQMQPDFFVSYITTYFSQFFASLIVAKRAQALGQPTPIYDMSAILKNGATFQSQIGI